jgi:hypothetical protein
MVSKNALSLFFVLAMSLLPILLQPNEEASVQQSGVGAPELWSFDLKSSSMVKINVSYPEGLEDRLTSLVQSYGMATEYALI